MLVERTIVKLSVTTVLNWNTFLIPSHQKEQDYGYNKQRQNHDRDDMMRRNQERFPVQYGSHRQFNNRSFNQRRTYPLFQLIFGR